MNRLHALVDLIVYQNQETTSENCYPIINYTSQVYLNCHVSLKPVLLTLSPLK